MLNVDNIINAFSSSSSSSARSQLLLTNCESLPSLVIFSFIIYLYFVFVLLLLQANHKTTLSRLFTVYFHCCCWFCSSREKRNRRVSDIKAVIKCKPAALNAVFSCVHYLRKTWRKVQLTLAVMTIPCKQSCG